MGWNDHFDPDEYDPADADSMRELADRAKFAGQRRRQRPLSAEDQAFFDALPKGDCWDCWRTGVTLLNGLCGSCYTAHKL